MPSQSKLDNFLLLAVTLLFTFSSLSSAYFSYGVYASNRDSRETQSKELLVLQNKNIDEGKVLAGGGDCFEKPYITITNNTTSSTNIGAKYIESGIFNGDGSTGPLYTLCIYNEDEAEHQIIKNGWPSSTTYAYSPLCPNSEGYSCNHTLAQFKNPGTYTFYIQAKPSRVVTITASSPSSDPPDSPSNTPSSPSSPSSDSSTPSTGTTTQTTTAETLKDVDLPKVFTKKGSKTTNLAKISNLKKIKGFTLDVSRKNLVVFNESLDLSSDKLIAKFKSLDKYVKMGTIGKVEIDSKALPVLNKKASIVMSGLKFVSEPEVLIDGKKDTKKVISDLLYNKEKGTLTFNVAHFTSFWAVPKLELLEPATKSIKESTNSIKGRISDPTTVITGRLNEVNLASYTPDEKTGEFVIDNITLQEGENFLTLEAESAIHKILPLVTTLTYSPTTAAPIAAEKNQTHYVLLLVSSISALIFLILVGYLVYRKRKYFAKADTAAKPQVSHA